MKKIAIAALALAAATGIALAEVTSANTVGYTTKTVNADTFYLCGIQFEEVGNGTGAIKLNDLVTMSGIEAGEYGTMTTAAPQIQILNASGSGYDMYYFIGDAYDAEDEPVAYDCWADSDGYEATSPINIGKGFWFKAPSDTVKGTASIQLKGQVSGADTGSISFTANTFSLASNPYPIATDLSQVTISGIQAVGYNDMYSNAAQIQVLQAGGGGYDMYYFINDAYDANDEPVSYDCWADSDGYEATGGSIPVGEGFWVKSPKAGSITFSL